jgi:hypothetical protein
MDGDSVSPSGLRLAAPLLGAMAVAVAIYLIGRQITPDYNTTLFGRTGPDTLSLKSWLATGVLALALLQLLGGMWMFGRLPAAGAPPRPVPTAHRLFGVAALLLTVPIAYHCMLAYGVQTFDTRVAVHSLAGCLFYGAFAAKITVVRSARLPGWTLPVAGGLLVTLVAVLWYSSALWYFNDFSVPFLG